MVTGVPKYIERKYTGKSKWMHNSTSEKDTLKEWMAAYDINILIKTYQRWNNSSEIDDCKIPGQDISFK